MAEVVAVAVVVVVVAAATFRIMQCSAPCCRRPVSLPRPEFPGDFH